MFNLNFTSSDKEDEEKPAEQRPPQTRGGNNKRSRRRRTTKSRKAQVEPMMATTSTKPNAESTPKKHHDAPMTKSDIYFALDCEMVGVGEDGLDSAVARITIVNWENVVVFDTYVKVPVPVSDYRTYVSGIVAQDIESDKALPFEEARSTVTDIIRGKILIGHGLENDLRALGLTHPESDVRDTACYAPYMQQILDSQTGTQVLRPRKLRDLTREVLGREIQLPGCPHCPIDDAIASLDLYKVSRYDWEKELSRLQREKAQEEEKQERRWRYNFFWSSQPPPPTPSAAPTQMYNPNAGPHNMHYLPMPHDPRLSVSATHSYGVHPATYAPITQQQQQQQPQPTLQMTASTVPPPPPPPPAPPQELPPTPEEEPTPPEPTPMQEEPQQQQQQQQPGPSPASFWFRFARPRSPQAAEKVAEKTLQDEPIEEEDKSSKDSETQRTSSESDVSFSLDRDIFDSSGDDPLPDMECLTLDSKSRSMTTVGSHMTMSEGDSVALPFYAEENIWG